MPTYPLGKIPGMYDFFKPELFLLFFLLKNNSNLNFKELKIEKGI